MISRSWTHLLLTKRPGACVLSSVSIGEFTRVLSNDKGKKGRVDIDDLSIAALGKMEGFNDSVAFEQTQLSEEISLLVVYLLRDVKWGLTERYATLVTIEKQQRMVVGERVLIGRDALQPPAYYGEFKLNINDSKPQLVLTRMGMGSFTKHVVFSTDAAGALRVTEQSRSQVNTPISKSAIDGSSIEEALQECGAEGARYALSARSCANGKNPFVERMGNVGNAMDGHIVDKYIVTCQGALAGTNSIYVDAYHCKRQNDAIALLLSKR